MLMVSITVEEGYPIFSPSLPESTVVKEGANRGSPSQAINVKGQAEIVIVQGEQSWMGNSRMNGALSKGGRLLHDLL